MFVYTQLWVWQAEVAGACGRMEQGRLLHSSTFPSLRGDMKRDVGRHRFTWE